MKKTLFLIGLLAASNSFAQTQTPAPASPSCTKNVSFAVAEGGQPVPAVPKFASKWLGGKSPREHYVSLCFSQIPSTTLPNYVVIFSTTEAAFEGLTPTALTYTSNAPGHLNTAKLNSSGGTWTYGYAGAAPAATTDTLSLKRDDKPKALVVRAYDQTGKLVSHSSLTLISNRDKLLEHVLSDIAGNAAPTGNHSSVPSPFSVYYVNCDVDAPLASPPVSPAPPARTETASAAAKPAPPPDPKLEIWSSPGGADIFLDGGYIGKTPYSLSVSEGVHTVSLRKKDFGIWQRRMDVTSGTRRVGGYLEQKVLELP